MIVWEGDQGALYDCEGDSWKPISRKGSVSGHPLWCGQRMIVWGDKKKGARYSPSSDSWAPINASEGPPPV